MPSIVHVGIVSYSTYLLYYMLITSTSSTRNSRIERLWVEVGTQFARRWRAFFTRLENYHGLRPDIPSHIWLLQTLFLGEINRDCYDFQAEWNCHPISGPDTNDKSPKVSSQMHY
jgi:hypothetical protein